MQEYSFYTDGRGETNLGRVELWPSYVAKFESVSGWQKERLLVKYNTEHLRSIGSGVSDQWVTRKDEWRLGSDGRTLILNYDGAIWGGRFAEEKTHLQKDMKYVRKKVIRLCVAVDSGHGSSGCQRRELQCTIAGLKCAKSQRHLGVG